MTSPGHAVPGNSVSREVADRNCLISIEPEPRRRSTSGWVLGAPKYLLNSRCGPVALADANSPECMKIYMFIHTFYPCLCTCLYTLLYTCPYAFLKHVYTHPYTHDYTHVYTYACVHVYTVYMIHMCIDTPIHMSMHTVCAHVMMMSVHMSAPMSTVYMCRCACL